MSLIRFAKVNRNTQAYVVDIGGVEIYISYETVIAIQSEATGRLRRDNNWGRTTGRHMNELGIKSWPIVSEEEMNTAIARAFAGEDFLNRATRYLVENGVRS
jgi:hypothetical protein